MQSHNNSGIRSIKTAVLQLMQKYVTKCRKTDDEKEGIVGEGLRLSIQDLEKKIGESKGTV